MKIWKNTATLDGFDDGLLFTDMKAEAEIALLGSKSIDLSEFPKLRGIFRAGIGRDNVPVEAARKRRILVRFPNQETVNLIYEETADFTCGLILRMLYADVGTLDPWQKKQRRQIADQHLLVIGRGHIGGKVASKMESFMGVDTFDILHNEDGDLPGLIRKADCISLHIPKTSDNLAFIDRTKLSWMKQGAILVNTARGPIVDEEALYNILVQGRIRAAFDVYWQEPYRGKLASLEPDRFYMTPHVASTCTGFLEGCRRTLDELIQELDYA